MRYSQLFIPTLKETPAEAEVTSHKLMIRAGMIRKLAAGIYSTLPLGLRVLRNVENIIREEMNATGAQEVFLPCIQPAELWQESGRWKLYGKDLLRIKDRHDRDFCFGPTHEEVITDILRKEVRSYRQLPISFYQIQTKFRDEIRPRFGVMRGREFMMKDAYSFDCDEEGAERAYKKMYQAYCNIFKRCGLSFKAVEADSGTIGGSYSHEFMVMADSGEEAIAFCDKCDYAANLEKAEIKATDSYKKNEKKKLKSVETPGMTSVEEVSSFLKVTPKDLAKTLLFETEKGTVAAMVRGDHQINEIKLKNITGCSEINLAREEVVKEISGAPTGFTGPMGLKIAVFADHAIQQGTNFVTGANKADYHLLNVNEGRDFSVKNFCDIRNVEDGDPCPKCSGQTQLKRGIEVGHVFKLGEKYSKSLKATFLDKDGKEKYFVMGCYGIGVGRTMAAAIEQNFDQDGIIWPIPIAPFQVMVIPLNVNSKEISNAADKIYDHLLKDKIEVLIDDRDERPGVKFKDADLLGIPLQIIIGDRTLKESAVELKIRKDKKIEKVGIDKIAKRIVRLLVSDQL
ncbi:MAG TPA: proline--tRNA ligase [Nitrospinota bacterium]|jgi:prolyl-tRNA synthetase|nr:proline--tRNA ligase [Nitrospinota bacterium]HJN03241.1 proline--tRNA ligase [Nitrospinota bacterium]